MSPHTSPVPPFPTVTRGALATLQVNLGYRCNQACHHCHVDAGPQRSEEMQAETLAAVLEFLHQQQPTTLDITGGAPELNAVFRPLVRAARDLGIAVIDRCNLTILEVAGQEDLAAFLAEQRVRVVASLPCHGPDNVDRQRGKGVFAASIRGLQRLNALGYGAQDSGLQLDLVYNPVGAHLPPPQAALEADYRVRLRAEHGVVFNHLLTLTNQPIARFRHALARDGKLDDYLRLLVAHYDAANLPQLMCRSTLSVDWRGYIYDCDFNQMLDLPAGHSRRHLRDVLAMNLQDQPIAVADHCYACTAGQGSSCGGALAA